MGLDWYYKQNDYLNPAKSNNADQLSLRNEELKAYVEAAQALDPDAINKLCAAFEPLLRHEVFRSGIRGKENLEDAYQQAYKYFIELILEYKDDDFSHLPGLIRLRIHSRLQRSVASLARINSNEQMLYASEATEELAAPDAFTNTLDQLSLAQNLDKLPPQQSQILQKRYLANQTQEEVAQTMNLSSRWVRKMERKGLDQLNTLLS